MAGDVPRHVLTWAADRQRHRDAGDYAAADAVRERIAGAGYQVTDTPAGPVVTRAPRFEAVTVERLPDRRDVPDAHQVSVLLLLDAFGHASEPDWVAGDARACLAALLEHTRERDYEVVILDNGVGGAAGDWAADAARNPGIEALHLAEPLGFAAARTVQHRAASGRVLLWLDTGVVVAGDVLARLRAVFDDPSVGVAGRWGADMGSTVRDFAGVEAPATGTRDVDAVWGYLLGLRRDLVRGGLELDAGFRFYRNADADLSFAARAAGARTVLVDLPATQRVHRGYAETPTDVVERESARNYRRLLDHWRDEMQRLSR